MKIEEFEEQCLVLCQKHLDSYKKQMKTTRVAKDKQFNNNLTQTIGDALLADLLKLGTQAIEINQLPKSKVFQIAKFYTQDFTQACKQLNG